MKGRNHILCFLLSLLLAGCVKNDLPYPTIKGVIFGLGVWHVGEIKGNPAMQEAYETGKRV